MGRLVPIDDDIAVGVELEREHHLHVGPRRRLGQIERHRLGTISSPSTMKMMRSTSVMSTSGVTLIPMIPSSTSPCDAASHQLASSCGATALKCAMRMRESTSVLASVDLSVAGRC